MDGLLIAALAVVCLALIVQGMRTPGKIYEFPFLAGATFLGFVLPQMPALANDPFLPPDAFTKTALFTILCAAMCGIGWSAARRPVQGPYWTFDERRLLGISAFLSLFGAFFFYKISQLPDEMRLSSQMTGLPVAYLFFAALLTYGFAIAVFCFAKQRSWAALVIAAFDSLFYLDAIVFRSRRQVAIEFLLVIALAAWFQRGVAAPRVLALTGIFAGSLALVSTGAYREIAGEETGPSWSKVSTIDVLGNFDELLELGGPEMRNAVLRIHAVDRSMAFDYGMFHWNAFVSNYVPTHLLGREFKESLLIPFEGQVDSEYDPPTGSTETGMADAFASFWYFGALKFFLISYLLGRMYRTALAGSLFFQLLYALSMSSSMLTITHHTQFMFSAWVHMAIFLVPSVAIARVRLIPSHPPSTPGSADGSPDSCMRKFVCPPVHMANGMAAPPLDREA